MKNIKKKILKNVKKVKRKFIRANYVLCFYNILMPLNKTISSSICINFRLQKKRKNPRSITKALMRTIQFRQLGYLF